MSGKNLGVAKTQDKIGHALYNMLFSIVPTDILDEGKNVALKLLCEPSTLCFCDAPRIIQHTARTKVLAVSRRCPIMSRLISGDAGVIRSRKDYSALTQLGRKQKCAIIF